MLETKGKCKHGEFDLMKGCSQCIEERLAGELKVKLEAEYGANDLPQIEPTAASHANTAIAFRPGEDVEVLSYYAEGQKLLDYAEGRYIRAIEDYKVAVDDLSIISRLKKAMEARRKEYIEPLKTQVDAINATYKTLMDPVLSADKITRDKMLAYDARVRAERAEQERINNLRMEAAKAEMALTGELTESVNLVEVTPEQGKTARTEMGTSSVTDRWTFEVIDELLIPREYLVIDHAQLTAIARSHHDKKNVPGIKFVNKPIISNRAR